MKYLSIRYTERLAAADRFNHRRLFGPIGNISPAEFEVLYDGSPEAPVMVAGLT
jgi:hypothetical protein